MNRKIVSKLINHLFINPQETLGCLKNKDRKLDNVHLISIKLLSGTPIKGRGSKIDPLLIKLGFVGLESEIEDLDNENLNKIISNIKRFDEFIGTWTIIHDLPATKERGLWRICADISPINCLNASIEKTFEESPQKILCIDCEGSGIFMGNPKK